MKQLPQWSRFVAKRWFSSGKNSGPSLKPAIAGIAVGVAALICIIGVMNGFQMGYIDAVLELDSFHLRVPSKLSLSETQKIISSAKSVMYFADLKTMIMGRDGHISPVRIKVISDDYKTDKSFVNIMQLRSGNLDKGIVLGSELARQLNVRSGDTISVVKINADIDEGIDASVVEIPVSGIYRCGHYAFDSGLAFITESNSQSLAQNEEFVTGIKLNDRYFDQYAIAMLENAGISNTESWRVYNKSFFGALRMEKSLMFMLVGLIFLVVGVNIFHSMRKAVYARMEDIATIKAFGADSKNVKNIFIFNGIVSGFIGAFIGLCCGLFIVMNIEEIFNVLEIIINSFVALFSLNGKVSIFSSDLFYISGVEVRLQLAELVFITISGAFSSIIAAWAASSRVSKIMPQEVLRDE